MDIGTSTASASVRPPADDALIQRAKRVLMRQLRLDEPVAYDILRRASMDRRVNLADLAQWLLIDAPRRCKRLCAADPRGSSKG
jgi:hypothetical protein